MRICKTSGCQRASCYWVKGCILVRNVIKTNAKHLDAQSGIVILTFFLFCNALANVAIKSNWRRAPSCFRGKRFCAHLKFRNRGAAECVRRVRL